MHPHVPTAVTLSQLPPGRVAKQAPRSPRMYLHMNSSKSVGHVDRESKRRPLIHARTPAEAAPTSPAPHNKRASAGLRVAGRLRPSPSDRFRGMMTPPVFGSEPGESRSWGSCASAYAGHWISGACADKRLPGSIRRRWTRFCTGQIGYEREPANTLTNPVDARPGRGRYQDSADAAGLRHGEDQRS